MIRDIIYSIPQDLLYLKSFVEYLIRYSRVRFMSRSVDRNMVVNWLLSRRVFFIVGLGRSGTNWLANLLHLDDRADVYHEPFDETVPCQYSYWDRNFSYRYFKDFRIFDIYFRARHDRDIYGEVNSHLRRFVEPIMSILPNARLIYLVRDGRDVVRSMYNRFTMMPNAYDTRLIRPKPGDPLYLVWDNLSRFTKLCWYWARENEYLLRIVGNPVRFEDLINDYEYFYKNVLRPTGLEIPYEVWNKYRSIKLNISRRNLLPRWSEWSPSMKKVFEDLCGDLMLELGYEFK